ncbi:hypothetical protein N7517_004025 [Penicillium concentricum]|uniref:Uncharacterized protein n=1 Tax=Penicillium concentricum TaxID=293559 RepID=A0A9W9S7D6_9EURO|nr:uncharacterized protein N7517_004025 [Penicillium concentricum]KAJ5372019.1 hypothetical protein N7517_004025 [Penicillium concentricum]
MAGQNDEMAEPTRPAERIKIGNSMAQINLSKTIAIFNPYTSSNSPSDQINISIFEQELSVLLNSIDFRFKLPANSQPHDAERLMRVIFHHPILPSAQLEVHYGSTSQAAKASEIQSSEKKIKILLDTPSIDERSPSDNAGLGLLNGLRTTLEERSFLRSKLGMSWIQENDEGLDVQNDQDDNSESSRSASEYNPFILGGLDPDEGSFLEF